ncbi:MAG: T9SS type A sorting domain-containing protein [Bacteroidales bacterium]|jgi:uncharacterized membrane protein|nr:T9SS type A sorting domain-containing protein [Bacteroidales bacterium]
MNIYKISGKVIFTLLIIAFSYGNSYAQHLFSVSYDDLSQENTNLIKTEATRFDVSASTMSMTTNRDNQDVYSFSLSSVQNTKIVILNEETGKSVVITPTDDAPAQFELPPFFIEELRQAALGNAAQYLVVETDTDFSVKKAASISVASQEVFIPRYFYGTKENVKEALPKDRQIVHIFKEKPILIPAFPDNPQNLRYVAQLEEEMSYYVYMYQLPDGAFVIYDEHFNPSADVTRVANTNANASLNLQFNLSGNTTGQAHTATLHALNLWSEQLAGTVPVDINVTFASMGAGILGGSYRTPSYLINGIFYPSPLANQLLGYNFSTQRDIRIEMSSNFSFYFGLDGNTSGYDYVTIMLHEVTHGLGFFPLCGSNGAYTYTTSTGGSSNTSYPSIYDYQLFQGATGNTCLTDLTQTQRASLVISGNLYAGRPGSHLLVANGGVRVKMYAPNPWRAGSSVSHWDNNPGFVNFMQYSYQYPLHTFNARKIGMMLDMGWKIPISCVSIFANQPPITTNETVIGCNNLEVQNVTIASGASVTMTAGETIIFKPGFYVEEGANFIAQIVPYDNFASYQSAGTMQMPEQLVNTLFMAKRAEVEFETEEMTKENPVFYPNPTRGIVYVETRSEDLLQTISVFSANGQMMQQHNNLNAASGEIDLSEFNDGMYIIRLKAGDKDYFNKIILQK